MIPLFTPAAARKDVNKTPGDGELAKLANLNRLVENVNTIVAQGLPASPPVFSYTVTGGTVPSIKVDYVISSGDITTGVVGQNTISSYYVPVINVNKFTASSISFFTQALCKMEWYYQNNPAEAPVVSVINFPTLTNIITSEAISASGQILLQNVSALTTLSAPLLTSDGGISIDNCSNFTTLNIPNLIYGYVNIDNCDSLSFSGISFNSAFANFSFSGCSSLGTTITIPATTIDTSIYNCSGVTTVSFPNAVNYSNPIYINNCSSLANITLGSVGTVKSIYYNEYDGAYVNLSSCALSSASVTHVLDILISLDGTNGTTEWGAGSTLDISGGTSAVPSAGDLVKIGILEARGATVNYNT